MTPDAPIAVVGAGIGGLTAALLLSRAGRPVTLIERRAGIEEVGAGLQLSPNASRVLVEADLGAALLRRATQPARIRIRHGRDGHDLASIPLGATASERYGAPYLVIHRADLAEVLLDAVRAEPRVRLLYARQVVSCADTPDGVALTVRGGRGDGQEIAAAAIAADGLWSTLARPASALRFAGHAAWRALLPAAQAPHFARAAEIGLWLGDGAHLVHYPVRDGAAVNVVAVLPQTQPREGWSSPGEASGIGAAFARWSPAVRDLIAAAPAWQSWSLFDRPPRRAWGTGRLTLLGDAAHPLLPFLAQGAALAIEDAAVLARLVRPQTTDEAPGALAAALRRYEAARRRRTAHAQREARRNAFRYHAPWPLSAARDAFLATAGGKRLLTRYDWLYGWRDGTA